jgi:hypothetical protein
VRIHEPLGFAKANGVEGLLKWSRDYAQDVGHYFRRVTRLLNGEVSFGNGFETSNIKGEWINTSSNASVAADTAIQHSLGVVPAGFILMIPPASGIINIGITPWTPTHIYLKASVASQPFRIFIVAPPSAD